MAEPQATNWGDLFTRLLGTGLSSYIQYRAAQAMPKQSFELGKQFDQAEKDMTRQINEQLGQRGMSGAPAVTGAAMRPLADLKAQRALLESQVNYGNQMQDYQNKMNMYNQMFPYLFNYQDEGYQNRSGMIPGLFDLIAGIWKRPTNYGGAGNRSTIDNNQPI